MAKLTVQTILPDMKHTHYNSIESPIYRFPRHLLQYEEKVSTVTLKDKGLLVPARLALKRQRGSLKPATMKTEAIDSSAFQIELGHTEDFDLQNSEDFDKHHAMQSTPFHPNSVRGDTPHTQATDISVMYREKPLTSHPVTGQYIAQHGEDTGGPSPCSYVLPRRPYREKNAPAYTFETGSRTGWQKQWFAHSDPYTTKVDFNRETAWPSPVHYEAKTALGKQTSKVSFPSWSFAARLNKNPNIFPENNPSPDTYNTISAFHKLTGTNTYITMKSRTGGSQLSAIPIKGKIPGPGAHDQTKFLSNKHSAPKYSLARRLPISLRQDPYVNTLPSVET
ncbi:unnamed protein product [Adineta steineri]|uniref:Uncharacterized protein n=1 Tax=Adineta steineri TaxID=433720 RepID=A0A818K9Y4_9BILA|nr:unnamed protein product [Adineta steineri]CAF1491550.1 unnamed protein product [Adineta steineri]CAF1600470.1 unnamed protein product [Adineta steineri]CAF3553019.1 unnamed protein product [Adineta steineri]